MIKHPSGAAPSSNPSDISADRFQQSCFFLITIIVENLKKEPYQGDPNNMFWAAFDASKYKADDEKDYQVYSDYENSKPIESLLIVARTNELHQQLDRELDLISNYIRAHNPDMYFNPEHDTDSYQKYPFGNYVIRFQLNLAQIQTFNIIYVKFLREYEKRQLTGDFTPYEGFSYELFSQEFSITNDRDTKNKDLLEFLTTLPIRFANDVNSIERQLTENPKQVVFLSDTNDSHQIPELKQLSENLTCLYTVLEPDKTKTLINCSSLSARIVQQKGSVLGAMVCIEFATLSEVNLYQLHPSYHQINQSQLYTQMQTQITDANRALKEIESQLRRQLAGLYQQKYQDKPLKDIMIPMTLCVPIQTDLGCQQFINTPYIQCKIAYLFEGPFNLVPDINQKLLGLIDGKITIPTLSAEVLLEKMGFYENGDYYINVGYVNPKKINPAWQFGLSITVIDNIIEFYRDKLGKPQKGIEGVISISLPNLALLYLLTAIDGTTEPATRLAILTRAAIIIKEYDLIVPEKYRQALFDTKVFTPEEQEQAIKKFESELAKQSQFSKEYWSRLSMAAQGALNTHASFFVNNSDRIGAASQVTASYAHTSSTLAPSTSMP